ncbi:glycosyl transferase [Streptomyces sp. M19]
MRCAVLTLDEPGAAAHGIREDGTPSPGCPRPPGPAGCSGSPGHPRGPLRPGPHPPVPRRVLGRPAARLAGVRAVVTTEHALGEHHVDGVPLDRNVRARYLATERLGVSTLAVSAAVADRLRDLGVPGHRVHLMPGVLDTARFRFRPAVRAAARDRLGLPDGALVVGRSAAWCRASGSTWRCAPSPRSPGPAAGRRRGARTRRPARAGGTARRHRPGAAAGERAGRSPGPATGPRTCPDCWPPWTCWWRPRRRRVRPRGRRGAGGRAAGAPHRQPALTNCRPARPAGPPRRARAPALAERCARGWRPGPSGTGARGPGPP